MTNLCEPFKSSRNFLKWRHKNNKQNFRVSNRNKGFYAHTYSPPNLIEVMSLLSPCMKIVH